MAGLNCVNRVALLGYHCARRTSSAGASHRDISRICREAELSSESATAVICQRGDGRVRRRDVGSQRRAGIGARRFDP